MPSVALKFGDLQAGGAVVEARVAPPVNLSKRKGRSPETLPLTALIDTGASVTVLKRGLPAFLGLKPTSNAMVHTASSANILCDEFAVSLILPHGFKIRTTALELPLNTQGIDCLIGRDVLAQCVMTYVGPENQVILCF
ncbi:MAG: aspartyl protease family protein [Verrucomicrobiota bacterium]